MLGRDRTQYFFGDRHDRLEAYRRGMALLVTRMGIKEGAAQTDLSETTLEDIQSRTHCPLTLTEAGAITGAVFACDPERVRQLACDNLRLAMCETVMDVTELASSLDVDTAPAILKGQLSGAGPFPLREYTAIEAVVARARLGGTHE